MDKSISQEIHAKNRLKDRHGIPPEAYEELLNQIQAGESVFLKKTSLRITQHLVRYKNRLLVAVYDRYRHKIVTFLRSKRISEGVKYVKQNQD